MIRQFIRSHIKALFKSQTNTSFDNHLRQYYRDNKTLGPNERSIISQLSFDLLRNKLLLENFTNDIDRQLDLLSNVQEYQERKDLPLNVRCSVPQELFEIISNQYGEQKAFEYFMASNEKAPLTIRANPIKTTREELMKQMKLYYKKTLVSPFGLILSQKNNINLKDTDQFRDGLFEIQDEASQICALKVKCLPKQKVLDYCCGSGGKTLAFAHQMQNQGLIEIYDTREDALIKARQRFKRAGIQNYQNFSRKYKFDWILLDVPCSGLGTLRRNPDIKYKVNKRSLSGILNPQQELTYKQQQIFKDAIPYLNRDGYIVYTTCSFVKQENEDQVKKFCREYGLQVVDCFQSLPEIGQMDSFFSVTLQLQQ